MDVYLQIIMNVYNIPEELDPVYQSYFLQNRTALASCIASLVYPSRYLEEIAALSRCISLFQ